MDERDLHGMRRWLTPDADVPDALREVLRSAAADEAGPERLAQFIGRAKSAIAVAPAAPSPARFAAGKSLAVLGAVAAGGALVAWLAFGSHADTRPHANDRAPSPASTDTAVAHVPRGPAPAPSAPSSSQPSAPAPVASLAAPASPAAPAPHSAAPPRTPRTPADTLDREVRLLQAARQLLDSDPAGALRLAEQHRARFPNGVLVQEREVLSIQALARQGRSDEATSRADAFRQHFPGSAHMDQLPGAPVSGHN